MELYVHIPFCVRKCRYCSFVSYAAKEDDHEAYVNLLLKEAAARAGEAEEPVRTVYIGGGTPSLLSPSLFRKMSEGLRGIFGFDPGLYRMRSLRWLRQAKAMWKEMSRKHSTS